MASMKALSVPQPAASIVALGYKRILTVPNRVDWRGPLAIRASLGYGMKLGETAADGPWEVTRDRAGLLLRGPIGWPYRLPLGAWVAVVDIVDCVPVAATVDQAVANEKRIMAAGGGDQVTVTNVDGHLAVHHTVVTDTGTSHTSDFDDHSKPFDWWANHRWALMLDNIRPIRHPIPGDGFPRMWNLDPTIADQLTEAAASPIPRKDP